MKRLTCYELAERVHITEGGVILDVIWDTVNPVVGGCVSLVVLEDDDVPLMERRCFKAITNENDWGMANADIGEDSKYLGKVYNGAWWQFVFEEIE